MFLLVFMRRLLGSVLMCVTVRTLSEKLQAMVKFIVNFLELCNVILNKSLLHLETRTMK